MSNRWDFPGHPASGEPSEHRLFEAVGRCLTSWEMMEFSLSRLYSIFVGDIDGKSLQNYGEPRIFAMRLEALQTAAERHFRSVHDQATEGLFDLVCAEALGFSQRRNEIAHGVVLDGGGLIAFREQFSFKGTPNRYFVLVPPLQTIRKHGPDGLPAYSYNATTLDALSRNFDILMYKADILRSILLKQPNALRLDQLAPYSW